MTAPNMDVVRPTVVRTETLSLPLAAALQASASPAAALPLIQGEWLTRAGDVWARPGTGGGAEITVPMWIHANQRGATTVQSALRTSGFIPPYEAWTLVWDALVAPPTAYGDALTTAVLAGGTYAGYAAILKKTGAGATLGFAVGAIPSGAGQRLYFRANY